MTTLSNCPPGALQAASGQAFRFVCPKEDGIHPEDDSFLPHSELHGRTDCCAAFALSMFRSEEQAREFVGRIIRKHKRSKLGTHIAKGTLDASHGVVSKPDAKTHFNLYEKKGSSVVGAFVVVGGPLQ